jgi:ectoine hydroxylase-related dioxygenase (phytanoyl-CoA dioxygenase family)
MTTAVASQKRLQYETDGFLIVSRPVIPAELVARATEGMDAIRRGEYDTGRAVAGSMWKPGDDPAALCKIEQPQFGSKAVMALISHPALGALAAEITGAQMVQAWWVQLLYKPSSEGNPESRTSIGFHQDRSYWGQWEEGSELFTAWVALSDVGADCGPMRFVRGSHRWGLSPKSDFFEQNVEGQRSLIGVPEGETWEEAAALLPPGGVSFHHHLTLHGSGPNHSGTPRRSFAIHLRTEKSQPVGGKREGLTTYIDDPASGPILYGAGAGR